MPHPNLTCVFGKPTHKQIKTVICELSANVVAISGPWGHSKGHLGLLQDPAIYLARNREGFNIPHVDMLNLQPTQSSQQVPQPPTLEELGATNAAAQKAWNTYKMVLTITCNQFAVAINDVYYPILDDPTKGLNAVNLCTPVMHILNTYAKIRCMTT
jgi:hypothetical protein